ncbi:MAG: ABC transporter permease subunit [Candidatus Thorarchaeota archaeon]|jgi:ABC-type dipeptide/oligopeptide/nickel transport system permease component
MALRDQLIKRSIQAVLTIFIVLTIDFAIFHLLPGSIVDRLARNPNISEQAQQLIIIKFGLDQPLIVQFGLFMINFLQGDFGTSFFFRDAVGPIITTRLINTLFLMIPADIFAIFIGIWIGKISAWHRGKARDVAGLLIALITYAIPGFWLAMMMLMIFGYDLRIVPTDPFNLVGSLADYPGDPIGFLSNAVAHLFLPMLVLVIVVLGVFALIMRNSLLDVLSSDYMLTAKAKGLTEKDQLNKEAYPNARIPLATVVSIQIGFAVVGALLIEIVFNYHGIGRLIWDAVTHRDYPVLQGAFFMFTTVLVVTNLVADFIYFYLDPRIRISTKTTTSEIRETIRRRRLPSFLTLLLIALIIADISAYLFAPSLYSLMIVLSVAAVAVIKWRTVMNLFLSFIQPFRISNLRHTWRTRRRKLVRRFSNLLSITGVLYLILVIISGVFSLSWFGAEPWNYPFVIITIGVVGIVLGSIIERPDRFTSIFNQILANGMGLAGLIVVIIFVGMAIFADIIVPFKPEQIGAGPLFLPPTPLPMGIQITMFSGIGLLVVGGLFWIFSNRRQLSPTPSWIHRTSTGFLVGVIGVSFVFASLYRANLSTLVAAGIVVFIGASVLLSGLRRFRNRETQGIGHVLPRILSTLLVAAGISAFAYMLFQISSYQPLDIVDFHLMGTDQLGRDMFSGIIVGSRITLMIGVLATVISISIGATIGLVSGYYGGKVDALLMRFTDIFFVIPSFILMIIVAAVVGPSLSTMLIVIGVFSWATTARIVRGQVLSLKERPYVERVRSVGGSNLYIITKHILPGVVPLVIVQTVLLVMWSIFFEVSLDFLGLGDPSIMSWGALLFLAQSGAAITLNMDWLIMAPGLAIVICLVGISFLGFGLDEVTNPRLRRR